MKAFMSFCVGIIIAAPVYATGDHSGAPISATPLEETRPLTADEQTIQDLLDVYANALEQRSVDLAEEAVIPGDFFTIESGYPNWTWQDFKENHLSVELDAFSDISYDIDLLSGEFQGDLGFCVYKYTASGTIVETGQSMTTSGLTTCILENTENGWRIHHLHSSFQRPMEGGH